MKQLTTPLFNYTCMHAKNSTEYQHRASCKFTSAQKAKNKGKTRVNPDIFDDFAD